MTIIIKLQVEMSKLVQVSNGTKVLDQFHFTFFLFQRKMREEVVKVLKPFFQMFILKILDQVCNMFAIMFDPWFKSLQIVKKLMGRGDAIRLVFKYDLKVIIPLLMTCFVTLNPNVETWT
jgi:hypothetical protein